MEGVIRCLVLACVATIVSSCAMVPAKLSRIHEIGQPGCPFEAQSLHALLEVALREPNEGESAHALGHVVERWRAERGSDVSGMIEPEADSSTDQVYEVRFKAFGLSRFSLDYFDVLSPAADYRVKRIERFTREGKGTPLYAYRENLGREPIEAYYPQEGITREVTAVLREKGRRGKKQLLEIELLCSLEFETVTLSGKREPLAADFSVALAALLANTKQLSRSEVADLLTPRPKRKPQLYLMERYDPNKEPLIMIHGLLDSPLAWADLTNSLRSDPELRRRYQVWHFLYNTSAPALYSGRILRGQYRELRRELDPGLDDRASRRTTLLTHSMGGLVARGLITDPGDAFWEAGFTRPLRSLDLSAEDRASLQEAFFWKPEPSIKRVIFIAVPHRGSEYADNWIGRIGQALVKPPGEYKEFYQRVSSANPGAFTEAYAELGAGELDSVGSLSPKQPTLQILSDLPLGYPVALHSIIGDRGKEGALEDSSDGVVDYWSSHLDDVASEKIVPSNHRALDDEETIREVERILRLR